MQVKSVRPVDKSCYGVQDVPTPNAPEQKSGWQEAAMVPRHDGKHVFVIVVDPHPYALKA